MAGYWVELDSARIAADEPPRAEIGVALRGRDIANATKPMPLTAAPSGSTTDDDWDVIIWWRIYVPDDVPSGAKLYWPAQIKVTKSSGPPAPGDYRLRLGDTYSDIAQTGSTTYQHHTFVVEVEEDLRGTEQLLRLYGRCIVNDPLGSPADNTHVWAASADEAHRCLASIRSS